MMEEIPLKPQISPPKPSEKLLAEQISKTVEHKVKSKKSSSLVSLFLIFKFKEQFKEFKEDFDKFKEEFRIRSSHHHEQLNALKQLLLKIEESWFKTPIEDPQQHQKTPPSEDRDKEQKSPN